MSVLKRFVDYVRMPDIPTFSIRDNEVQMAEFLFAKVKIAFGTVLCGMETESLDESINQAIGRDVSLKEVGFLKSNGDIIITRTADWNKYMKQYSKEGVTGIYSITEDMEKVKKELHEKTTIPFFNSLPYHEVDEIDAKKKLRQEAFRIQYEVANKDEVIPSLDISEEEYRLALLGIYDLEAVKAQELKTNKEAWIDRKSIIKTAKKLVHDRSYMTEDEFQIVESIHDLIDCCLHVKFKGCESQIPVYISDLLDWIKRGDPFTWCKISAARYPEETCDKHPVDIESIYNSYSNKFLFNKE